MLYSNEIIPSFIVFEGIDGSGTSTQLARLSAEFTARAVAHSVSCEPTPGPIGKLIRQALFGDVPAQPETIARLFAADRGEHIYGQGGIYDTVRSGRMAISDRYVFSSLAYQGLTCGRDLPEALNKDFPLPELLIYFDIAPEEAVQRIAARKKLDMFENLAFQQKTAAAYENILNDYSASSMRIVRIDASRSESEVAAALWNAVRSLMA